MTTTSSSKQQLPPKPTNINELAFYNTIKEFYLNDNKKELNFPSSLSSADRRVVHFLGSKFGLQSSSHGEGDDRYVRLTKERAQNLTSTLTVETMSKTLRRRFIKDFKLPITVVDSPYFENHVKQLDAHFQLKPKLDALFEAVRDMGTESAFLNYSETLESEILAKIKATKAYGDFLNDDLETKYKTSQDFQRLKKKLLYSDENNRKTFIGIDLSSADFNALKTYSSEFVLGFETWNDLITSFSKYKYFHLTKKYRQFILGEIVTAYHEQIIYAYLLSQVYEQIKQQLPHLKIFALPASDELLVEASTKTLKEDVARLQEIVEKAFGKNLVKVQPFRLNQFNFVKEGQKTLKFFVREVYTDLNNLTKTQPAFKCIPPEYFVMSHKFYKGETKFDKYDKAYGEGSSVKEHSGKFEFQWQK